MNKTNVDELIRFQTDRGLDKQEYDYLNACTNIVEELLEAGGMKVPKENRPKLRTLFETFLYQVHNLGISEKDEDWVRGDSEVDAYCDVIEFAIGEILKLKYNPNIALDEMEKEINSRVGTIVDGKFQKDTSDEAKAKWYKARYRKAKINNQNI